MKLLSINFVCLYKFDITHTASKKISSLYAGNLNEIFCIALNCVISYYLSILYMNDQFYLNKYVFDLVENKLFYYIYFSKN